MQASTSLIRAGAVLALAFAACSLDTAPAPCGADDAACKRAALTTDAGREAVVPVELRKDGLLCERDAQCENGHCNHGLCCTGGNCCLAATDCPGDEGVGQACDNTVTCQGTRGAITCEAFRCVTKNGVPDDSACTSAMEANACGAYRSVFCNGKGSQEAPTCPTTCRSDNDCDPGAHCNGTCVADASNGATCNADEECASGHCTDHVCCANGDCCRTATDCPSSYTTAAECDSAATCQGSRLAASCTNNSCGSARVEDDTACGISVRALVCGTNLDVFCSGQVAQAAPTCGSSCTTDANCVASAHCNGSICVADVPNGASCDSNGDCESGYCQNSICCGSGSCCQTANDCGTFVTQSCDEPDQCQGHRQDALCTDNRCSTSSTRVEDDSACTNTRTAACGDYADMTCNGAASQSTCRTSCTTAADCDAGLSCTANVCTVTPPTGG